MVFENHAGEFLVIEGGMLHKGFRVYRVQGK